jgi:hypothetical protein
MRPRQILRHPGERSELNGHGWVVDTAGANVVVAPPQALIQQTA